MPLFSIAGLAITAGAGIYGDISASQGQQDTNATNAAINQQNIGAAWDRQINSQEFNADQAMQARIFSGQQVAQQEQFQKGELQDVENYDTQMANTQIQRRVQDLKDAGLNPLLAAGSGGAAAPTVSAPTGGAAQGYPASSGPAGQGSGIGMQNPNAAFGNLGGQISSALGTASIGANIDLMNAQANKLNTEAGNEIPAQVDYLKSMTGLNNQQAQVASLNAQSIAGKLKYDLGDAGNNALDWTKNWATTGTASTNAQILAATKDALVSAQQSDATAKALGLQELRNLNDAQQGKFGQVIAYLNAILHPVSTAAGAAGHVLP